MMCLTICQPYASAIFMHESIRKRAENREWYCGYRGPLLIHAGKSRAWLDSFGGIQEDLLRRGGFQFDEDNYIPIIQPELFGAIIGLVEMTDCLSIEAYRAKYGDDPWAFGKYCHVYERPELLPRPIPYRGRQGLFDVPEEILKEVTS